MIWRAGGFWFASVVISSLLFAGCCVWKPCLQTAAHRDPVILVTDLYFPPEDPADNFDSSIQTCPLGLQAVTGIAPC